MDDAYDYRHMLGCQAIGSLQAIIELGYLDMHPYSKGQAQALLDRWNASMAATKEEKAA